MLALVNKVEKKSPARVDAFGKYLIESMKNTTVNGSRIGKKLSWYKRLMGLF